MRAANEVKYPHHTFSPVLRRKAPVIPPRGSVKGRIRRSRWIFEWRDALNLVLREHIQRGPNTCKAIKAERPLPISEVISFLLAGARGHLHHKLS